MAKYEELTFGVIEEPKKEEEKEKEISLFDIINDISTGGNLVEKYYEETGELPKAYSQYMINKAFGNFSDSLFYAAELNKYTISNETHWNFLRNTLKRKKRFGKWFKPESEEPLVLLATYFDCSLKEMRKNSNVLTKEQIDEILDKMQTERYEKYGRTRRRS